MLPSRSRGESVRSENACSTEKGRQELPRGLLVKGLRRKLVVSQLRPISDMSGVYLVGLFSGLDEDRGDMTLVGRSRSFTKGPGSFTKQNEQSGS